MSQTSLNPSNTQMSISKKRSEMLNATRQIPNDHELISHSKSLSNLYDHSQQQQPLEGILSKANLLRNIIIKTYRLDQSKDVKFQDSLLFYTKLINDSTLEQQEFHQLIDFIDNEYKFKDSPQNLGLLTGNLVLQKLDNPESKVQTQLVIGRFYREVGKDRQFYDFSKVIYLKLLNLINQFTSNICRNSDTFFGCQNYKKIFEKFENFYNDYILYFKQLWNELELNETNNQKQVANLIDILTKMQNKNSLQKNLQLFGFLFLLKFMLSQHKNQTYKISSNLAKIINSILRKISLMSINIGFRFMNFFLMIYQLIIEEELFENSKIKFLLSLFISRYHYMIKKSQFAQQFCQLTNQDVNLSHFEGLKQYYLQKITEYEFMEELYDRKIPIGFCYDSSQNKLQNDLQESINSFLSKTQEQQFDLGQYAIELINNYQEKTLKFVEDKLKRQEFLQLFMTFSIIDKMFLGVLLKIKRLVKDDKKDKILQELQTYYIATYMKVLVELISQKNSLILQEYISEELIILLYNEIMARLSQIIISINIKQIKYQTILDIIFHRQSTINQLTINIEQDEFSLKNMFEYLKQCQLSPKSLYNLLLLQNKYQSLKQSSQHLNKSVSKKIQILQSTQQQLIKMHQVKESKKKIIRYSHQQQQKSSNKIQQNPFKKKLIYDQQIDQNQSTTQFSLIKSSIFSLLKVYQQYYPINDIFSHHYKCYGIFCEFLLCIDNQLILIQIYRNILYKLLNNKNIDLVMKTYQKLFNLQNYVTIFTSNHLIRKEIITIFLQFKNLNILHIIQQNKKQIKDPLNYRYQNRKQQAKIINNYDQNKSKEIFSKNKYSKEKHSKSKYSKNKYNNKRVSPKQKQNKIYIQYFNQLLNKDYQYIIKYSQQLISFNRCYQSIYILECLYYKSQFKLQQIRILIQCTQSDYAYLQRNKIQKHIDEIQKLLKTCYLKVCHKPLRVSSKSESNFNNEGNHNDSNSQFQHNATFDNQHQDTQQSFIPKLTQLIINHQITLHQKNMIQQQQYDLRESYKQNKFKLTYYSHLYNFLSKDIKNIFNSSDIECFFIKLRFKALCDTILKQQPFMSQLKDIYPCLTPIQKYHLIKMVQQIKYQTMRLLTQSLLQTKQQHKLFKELKQYYGYPFQYQKIPPIQLESLMQFYYSTQSFQNVIAIYKHIKFLKINKTYGEQTYFVSWPQAYRYDITSKLCLYKCRQIHQNYWQELIQIIQHQNYLVIEDARYYLNDLKENSQNIKQDTPPQIYPQLINQLEHKIKQYFDLFRIMFTKLQFPQKNNSLKIFTIMKLLYETLFIPELVSEETQVHFWFYYLSYFCQKIDIEQIDQESVKYQRQQLNRFLFQNITYLKRHTQYMINSLDPSINSLKNKVLIQILTEILKESPTQNIFIISYLKNYKHVIPSLINNQIVFRQDPHTNKKYTQGIQVLKQNIFSSIDSKIQQLLNIIDSTFLRWMEITTEEISKKYQFSEFYLNIQQNIQNQIKETNQKLQHSQSKIPFPFDNTLYIKQIKDIKLSDQQKPFQCIVNLLCKSLKQDEQQLIQKRIILKNNWTQNNQRIEVNSAKFNKQIGILDQKTTYGINLTKYIIINQCYQCSVYELEVWENIVSKVNKFIKENRPTHLYEYGFKFQ